MPNGLKYIFCDFVFPAGELADDLAVLVEDFNVRSVGANRLGSVDHDQVAPLSFELLHRPAVLILGFQGEGDDDLSRLFPSGQCRYYIRRFDEFQAERLAGFANFVLGDVFGAIIARRGGGDQAVAVGKNPLARGEHFLRRNDGNHFGRGGIRHFDRPADDGHSMARVESGLGQRGAHPPARRVAQIADRVEIFPRRTGGDEDVGHCCGPLSLWERVRVRATL